METDFRGTWIYRGVRPNLVSDPTRFYNLYSGLKRSNCLFVNGLSGFNSKKIRQDFLNMKMRERLSKIW